MKLWLLLACAGASCLVWAVTPAVSDQPPQPITGSQLVEVLRSEHKVAVNFVQAKEERTVVLSLGRPVGELLGQLTTDGQYRQRTINGRLVIYPAASALEQTVHPPVDELSKHDRFNAAYAYIEWLRDSIPGLQDLVPPAVIGSDLHDAARPGKHANEYISLTPEAQILEHLVELLGANPRRVFTIYPNPSFSGRPVLSFRIIPLE